MTGPSRVVRDALLTLEAPQADAGVRTVCVPEHDVGLGCWGCTAEEAHIRVVGGGGLLLLLLWPVLLLG